MKLDPYGFEGLDWLWIRRSDEKSLMLSCVPFLKGTVADNVIHIPVARILHGVKRVILPALAEQVT